MSSSPSSSPFAPLESALESGGPEAVLNALVTQLRREKRYHELFEALKMRVRQRLGLPINYASLGEDLSVESQQQLEQGLLDACREVGMALLKEGHIREGWMYMRPVGERQRVAELLEQAEVTDENIEELIEVSLHEGVAPPRGFALVLERYGTCNAITTFDSVMPQFSRKDQQAAAGLLVRHVHKELLDNVRADIARQENAQPAEGTLRELVAERDWLFSGHSYHLDTTHLASTVRAARIAEDEEVVQLALELTEYGRRLNPQFQYRGEEPFTDIYPSHALWFEAILGRSVDRALEYFRQKAETLDSRQHGTAAVEVYVELLARVGRYQDAIEALIRLAPSEARPGAVTSMLLDLSEKAGDYSALLEYCRSRSDLLGFTTALLKQQSPSTTAQGQVG